MKNLSDPLKRLLSFLIGDPQIFTLEHRIFNGINLLGLLIIGYNIPFNYLTGLTISAYIFALIFLFLSGVYYLSRYKQKLNASITISSILINVMFAVNYFFSSGIQGASLLSFTFSFFLIMLITPSAQHIGWLLFNLLLVAGLITTEFYFPQSVLDVYPQREDIYIDMGSTYLFTITGIFAGAIYMKRAYYEEKKKREEKTNVLEILNAEKSKLFSIISHDLRNPLASIQSYLQLLQDIPLEEKEKTQIESELLYVVNNTQEMLTNILLWSKTQLDGLVVNLTPVNVSDAIMPIIQLNRSAASKKGISLQHNIDTSMSALADVNMLQLIVRNLIGNATKFTPAGGNISVQSFPSGDDCVIVVSDSGSGITAAGKDDIFSLKVRSTFGTENEKGIGLGLFLCKEYTNAQQGRIWHEDNEPKGSSFYLSLPLAN
ncbi:sensor histidine kinase [Chitinophaga nivalis]|uniref:histidine kinase n=1 Tax=Chitinophaga nivalis TaxID=2991709 RepID=A0ABT3IHY4_9BACT|nr:HAMP domain-containing sensor histidine kinase [Chitinophaga nivalis]MCW3466743.1 HAMP domain-containing histidine kinase [Chitinophaga nivalis]MCW3483566.1 HAMP domain-containing histidine kinase [Chitinophaga nivalis]